ncbi:leucyl/phenylalanyl-tRNA--protein transferase [Catenovulum maritimum]|uniref:Leucyl/phenylalanyl-tRNA--protein transferase n=1 Tax=Catenovulum maritimum TaxID=1513271 RepID=A0A0J8GUD9_9ALTE|nr:leucyl/phenylalanyl-tRNA--protein transferase [Catenovulum maritimum]
MALYQLSSDDLTFPNPQLALDNPNGLLAIGGDLSSTRLINAYKLGIFPWFNPEEPILWWSPNPRGVITPAEFKLNRSTKKSIKRSNFSFTVNQAFSDVIQNCAKLRVKEGTWISDEMISAYTKLHEEKYAHSIEVWQNDKLVGGLYGIGLGALFCGESMFHLATDASKAAFWQLCELAKKFGIQLIDCQMQNSHLQTLGIYEIERNDFLTISAELQQASISSDVWHKRQLKYEW